MLKRKAFVFILPCAGITLIRFYGYYLSFSRHLADWHPGKPEAISNVD
jgi:hypothetical protein